MKNPIKLARPAVGEQVMPEKLFGISSRGNGQADDGQGLKLVLHRYIIDGIEESGKNLLEAHDRLWRNLSSIKWLSTSLACDWPSRVTKWSGWPKNWLMS
ncbi:hypothetical protein PSA5_03125 [Pseudomonas syringae pv. actinidiae]|nr:hypothetical protein PSA5_03125 [Pseudomonas syringae pv. actinidiae]